MPSQDYTRRELIENLIFRVRNKLLGILQQNREASTRFGARMSCNLNDFIGKRIFHFGCWEPHISAFIQNRLRPSDIFCDVGANIGYYTLLAAPIVGPAGVVVAVEASPQIFRVLEGNVKLNGLSNVRLINVAAANKSARMTLYRGPSWNLGASTVVASRGFKKEADVPALPLEKILSPGEIIYKTDPSH